MSNFKSNNVSDIRNKLSGIMDNTDSDVISNKISNIIKNKEVKSPKTQIAPVETLPTASSGGIRALPTGSKEYKPATTIGGKFLSDVGNIGSNLVKSAESGLLQFGKTLTMRMDERFNRENELFNKTDSRIAEMLEKKGKTEQAEKIRQNIIANRVDLDNTQNYQDKINKLNQEMMLNTANTSNNVTQKIAGLSQSIGNNLVGMGVSALNPALGATYFTGSAYGSYYDEGIERGMNEEQAKKYATPMAIFEGLTEKALAKENIKGFKAILEGVGWKNALKSLGLEVGENFLQEAVMPTLSELTTETLVGDQYLKNDYRTKEGWLNLVKDSLSDGIDGALSAILLNGSTKMVGSCINVVNKVQQGQSITPQEIQTAVRDAQNAGVDTQGILQNEVAKVAENKVEQSDLKAEELPVANKKYDLTNQYREQAIDAIQKSKLPSQEKQQYINAYQNAQTLSQQDVDGLMQGIQLYEQEQQAEQNRINADKKKRQDYMKYKNDTKEYDSSVVNEVNNVYPTNRNGKRTVKQWLTMAEDIGSRISNKTDAEIERIAYKSWFDLEPSKSITRYDNVNKTNVAFQKLSADEWTKAIIDSANKNRQTQEVLPVANENQRYNNSDEELMNLIDENLAIEDELVNKGYATRTNVNGNIRTDLTEQGRNQAQEQLQRVVENRKRINEINNQTTSEIVSNKNVQNEVLQYIKRNDIPMSVDQFMDWASNKTLEQETNMTPEKQELFSLIEKVQNMTNESIDNSIEKHNIVMQNGQIVDKTTGMVYNNIDDDILIEVSADQEKLKYVPYSNVPEFFQNTVEDMDIISNKSSEEANRRFEKGKKTGKVLHNDKIYTIEITDNNNYKIIGINNAPNIVRRSVDGSNFNKDSKSVTQNGIRQGESNNNNEPIGKRRTSTEVSGLSGNTSGESGLYGSSGNNRTNVENSNQGSFSMQENKQNNQEDYSNNTAANEVQRKINRSMTMKEAENMIERAFIVGDIKNWFDGEYKNGLEWLKGEGSDAVALVVDNDYGLQMKFVNSNEDILNDEYTIEDVLDAYLDGTLTGKVENKVERIDTSKETGYKDDRFYAPRLKESGIETYNKANERVTNANRQEVYKARADFIINAHNEGYAEKLGLTQKQVNEKLRNWASYPSKARDLSIEINKGVAKENRWTGIENSSIVNELSVDKKQLDGLVKAIKGESNEWQRRYIANTMLAIDTHMDYKGLTYDFAPDVAKMGSNALADYYGDTDVIRVKRDGQNTIAHETGHFIDRLLGRKLGNGFNMGITTLCRNNSSIEFTQQQKQFLNNFSSFLGKIEDASDIGSTYKMSTDEVFARFVARFVEWTRNTATGGRYSYEANWYKDNFGVSHYKEFAKLLQEFSVLQTTGQVSNKITRGDSKLQEQKIDDIYSELYGNKTLNPSEIANLKKEDANTTPKLPNKKYEDGTKQSSFFQNVLEDSKFLNKDLRQSMAEEENIRYYKGITNEETLQKSLDNLQQNGKKAVLDWYGKDTNNTTAEDVTTGWILLQQYQDAGDYEGAINVAKKMREMGTKVGQAVQAYNIMSRLTPEGMFYYAQSELTEAYNKLVEGKTQKWIDKNAKNFELTAEDTQFIKDTMKDVAGMEDGYDKKVKLAQIQKLLTDKLPTDIGKEMKAWMRISMLFNPKTQVRNVMGNAVVLPVNTVGDIIASKVDKAISKKTGVRTTGTTNISNYAKGFKKGLYESYNDFKLGINTRNIEGNRFEISEGNSFNNNTKIGKALNATDKMLSFMLDAGDRGFYEATFTNSINNQLVLNNATEVTQDMIDIATQEALQRTWQDDNNYTKAVLDIRRILNNVNVKGYGLGDVIIPFAKTPANLTKAIVDYSPVGLVNSLRQGIALKNSLETGQYTAMKQHEFVQNLGKATAGTFLYVLGYVLAKAGIASGEPDDDKDVKNFMKNSLGISSYSIKIGNITFTYDWAQPVATPLAIMTNYVKYSEDNPDANAIEKGIKAMNIGTEQLLEQSFMESLNTVLNGNGTTLENLSKAVLDLPARAVPTMFKQVADMVDGTQRTSFEYDKPVESAINSVKSKIPFASMTLAPSYDTLGNEIKKYGGENNLFNVFLNPANVNKGELSKSGEEIYKVYQQTGDKTIFPRVAPYYINSAGEKITMDSKTRSKFQKVSGDYVEKSLDSLLTQNSYKNLNYDEKAKMINEIVSDSYNKAKKDVLGIANKTYDKLENTLKTVKEKTYYDYKVKTTGMTKDSEKINVLINSNYSAKETQAIYENYILDASDKKYDVIKTMGLNINEYLKYKVADTTSKDKAFNTIEGLKGTYIQKLALFALSYKVSEQEKKTLFNYVNSLQLTKTQKEELFNKFK